MFVLIEFVGLEVSLTSGMLPIESIWPRARFSVPEKPLVREVIKNP